MKFFFTTRAATGIPIFRRQVLFAYGEWASGYTLAVEGISLFVAYLFLEFFNQRVMSKWREDSEFKCQLFDVEYPVNPYTKEIESIIKLYNFFAREIMDFISMLFNEMNTINNRHAFKF